MTLTERFREEAVKGLQKRLRQIEAPYPETSCGSDEGYYERLEGELHAISRFQLQSEYLVVADCVAWARKHDIGYFPRGGLATASLAAYALGITDADPVRYGLSWERFLNPQTRTPPMFVIDFCQDHYEKVLAYAVQTHGKDEQTGKERHFLDYSPGSVKKTESTIKALNVSGHGDDIYHYISGNAAISAISEAEHLVQRTRTGFNLGNVRDDDPAAFAVAVSGQMNWIPLLWGSGQLEPDNIMYYLQRITPNNIKDLAAVLTLSHFRTFREVDTFIRRRRGEQPANGIVPPLLDVLDETYGVILYQEQIMEIISRLTGYTGDKANELGKIMGRKSPKDLMREERLFIGAAKTKGIDEAAAKSIFRKLEDAMSTSSIKAYAIVDALLIYQCSYLKAHFQIPMKPDFLTEADFYRA